MNQELPKAYDASSAEADIYKRWEESGYFNPDNSSKISGDAEGSPRPYTITMPPPNVTGVLHIGHALFLTIQDILIRFRRMQGYKTLWIPGTDSAAIATQAKVETDLYKKEGKTRHDFSREEFVKMVNDYALSSQGTILSQIKRMGASTDWSRLSYTLDEQKVSAVNTAFKRMYEDGLIYRGNRLVNWDPKLQTNVSDDEIEWKEETTSFYYLKYGPFTIGTARPETKFGDKYVVMHPEDARYAEYKHGQQIEVEWINGKVTATIIKDTAADPEFGTGVMTITPAHDAVDYEIAQRHGLDIEQIIDLKGILLPIAGELAGQHIKKARPMLIEKLQAKGLVEKIDENYNHRIATNSRGGGIIEPQIREQWFIDVNKPFRFKGDGIPGIKDGELVSLKHCMRHVVESGQIEIIPDHFKKIYFHWIDNLRDWCISRQILFGHQIPAWYDEQKNIHLPKEVEIIFARHGESESNASGIASGDTPLTKKGEDQARELGEKLKGRGIKKIYASSLIRSTQTAKIVAEIIGINENDIVFNDDMREFDKGDVGNLSLEECPNPFAEAVKRGTGEKLESLEARVLKFIETLKQETKGPILIAGHNITNIVIQAVLEGKKKDEFVAARERVGIRPNASVVSYFLLKEPTGENLIRDPDTLDTWFSSGLWTFSTLGWPNQTIDLETFHPTDVLETGYDILFFWVARMILMSTYHLGEIPFKTVYLHGLVRDKDRQKMSKSKGNIIDPLGVIDTYGTDALRFALIFSTSAGTDIPLAEDKIKGMKHFGNKIWNISRFIMGSVNKTDWTWEAKTDADKEILSKLDQTIEAVTSHLDGFRLHEAAQEIYQFAWHEFADVYIEASKQQMQNADLSENTQKVLVHVLINILKLLHPFMPFVTEYIWGLLKERGLVKNDLLIIQEWPKNEK